MHIYIKNNRLLINEYKVKCALGKRGIGNKKKEGDLITPKGMYKIKTIFYRKDRVPYLNSKIIKKPITKNMGWCDDPKSNEYNKLINLPSVYKHEKLYKKENFYDIIIVLNYNMNPTVKNKGSAIFIHVSKRNYKKTEGCVALKKNHLIKILKKLKKNTTIKIVNQK